MNDRTGILVHSPLTYTLASIRFASWPMMAKRIDEIHEKLREITPIINRIQITQVSATGQAISQGEDSSHGAWMLMSPDRLQGIQFAPDQVLVFSKRYTRYSEFASLLERTLRVLLEEMRFVDLTSLGVRYVDHIRIREGEQLDQYLTHNIMPPTISGLDKVGGSMFGVYKTSECELRVRVVAQPDGLTIPEDLIGLLAMIQEPGKPLQLELLGNGAMFLDIDAIKAHGSPIRLDNTRDILEQLNRLHIEANAFFRNEKVCTDHAFKVWGGKL